MDGWLAGWLRLGVHGVFMEWACFGFSYLGGRLLSLFGELIIYISDDYLAVLTGVAAFCLRLVVARVPLGFVV